MCDPLSQWNKLVLDIDFQHYCFFVENKCPVYWLCTVYVKLVLKALFMLRFNCYFILVRKPCFFFYGLVIVP